MTENNSKQPLMGGKNVIPPSTGGAETMDDLMDGGDYSLSVNVNVSKNQKLNTKV